MQFEITELACGKKQLTYYDDFTFENGQTINPLVLAYETYGNLSKNKDNVVIIHHALSTNSHVSSHDKNKHPGWWENMVGPDKPINTNRFYVICINNLASCFGSSGPSSIDQHTNKPFQSNFPHTTITDMVNAQRLLLSVLEIPKIYVMIGNSMGAMISLAWSILYPDDVKHLVSVSSCYKSYPANSANRKIQLEIIALDRDWNDGFYEKQPEKGFHIARKHGLLTYRNWQEINKRFLNKTGKESIDNYLDYNAKKFISQFDLNSYIYLLHSMDNFDITKYYKDHHEAFSRLNANVLIVSVDSDVLYTPDQQVDLYNEIKNADKNVTFIEHSSKLGHDAFLVEIDAFGKYISEFIN